MLLTTAFIPLAGRVQASPGYWASFQIDGELTIGVNHGISYAAEPSGVAHVTYYNWLWPVNAAEIKYAVVQGSGVSISTIDRFNESNYLYSDARLDAQGRFHALWMVDRFQAGSYLEYYVIADGLVAERANLTPILGLNLENADFSLAVDGAGNPHIALTDFNHNLYHVTKTGGSWTAELIGCVGNVGGGQSIFCDEHGRVHISYVNRTDYLEYNYTLRYATNATGSWVTIDVLEPDIFPYGTSVTTDSYGHVFIGFQRFPVLTYPDVRPIAYVTNVSGSFETLETPFLGYVYGSRWFSVDDSGGLMIVYNESRAARTSAPTDSLWVTQTIPGGWYVEEDDQGNMCVFYHQMVADYWQQVVLMYGSNRFELSEGPTQLDVAPEPEGARLTWSAPSQTGGLPVLGYLIFRGPDSTDTSLYATVGPSSTSYTFYNLSHETTYYFSVAPLTLVGTGANSSVVSTTPTERTNAHTTPSTTGNHTWEVIALTAVAVSAICILATYLLKKVGRARIFTAVFVCWTIALASVLPSYFANASWNSQQDRWTETVIPELTGSRDMSAVAVDGSGVCHVVFFGGESEGLMYSENSSGSWASETVDPEVSFDDLDMEVGPDGAVHIAYVVATENHVGELRYASNSGGSWNVTIVDNRSADLCSIAVAHDGTAHIGYTTPNGMSLRQLLYATNVGGAWSVEKVETSYHSLIWMGEIGVGADGSPRMVYNVDKAVRYATGTESGWSFVTLGGGYSPTLFINGNDVNHVCYPGITGDSSMAIHAFNGSDAWKVEELESVTRSSSRMIFDHLTGQLTILFRGDDGTSVNLARGVAGNLTETKVATTDWQIAPSVPAMAMSPSGEPVICVVAADNLDPRGGYRVTVFEPDLSAFTLAERMAKGWSSTQNQILTYWIVGEVLTGLAFLVTLRLGLWRSEGRTA